MRAAETTRLVMPSTIHNHGVNLQIAKLKKNLDERELLTKRKKQT